MAIQPVILAGGAGTRLWPLSRELHPKQVLHLLDGQSLLHVTMQRAAQIPEARAPLLVVLEQQRRLIQQEILERGLAYSALLLEPAARETGAAVAGAVVFCQSCRDANDILLFLPADHLIHRQTAFVEAVAAAARRAQEGYLVTFGLVPDRPETGFGYIAADAEGKVERFVEKPDLETARTYVQSGKYLWNSGMFAFRADVFLEEMQRHAPEMLAAMQDAVRSGVRESKDVFIFDRAAMERSPALSIDRALMEKTGRAAVVRCDLGWNDLGSWQTLWEVLPKDESGNSVTGDALLSGVSNSLIRAEHGLLAAIGLDRMLVVQSADAVLVAPLDQAQEVKKTVALLKSLNRLEYSTHLQVFHPWGSATLLSELPSCRIRLLVVNPGAGLPLHQHEGCREHWLVVSGKALVRNGNKSQTVQANESICILEGTPHTLNNPAENPLKLVVVQIGECVEADEDDDTLVHAPGR